MPLILVMFNEKPYLVTDSPFSILRVGVAACADRNASNVDCEDSEGVSIMASIFWSFFQRDLLTNKLSLIGICRTTTFHLLQRP